MEELISQYSVVGLVAVLIVRDFLKHIREQAKSKKEDRYEKLQREIYDLWMWHNKEDDNGVKVWYGHAVNEKLETIIKLLRENK